MDSLEERFEKLEDPARIGYLIATFLSNTLTIEEQEELDQWVLEDEANMEIFEEMTTEEKKREFLELAATIDLEARLTSAKKKLKRRQLQRIGRFFAVAAMSIGLFVILYAIYFVRVVIPERERTSQEVRSIFSSEKLIARLTQPGGAVVDLHEGQDSVFSEFEIRNGQISYLAGRGQDGIYHLEVLAKGFCKLVLADGSAVWLNAGSSISYPGNFSGSSRDVSVTGESYFVIAREIRRPFEVRAADVIVRALGTSFNIESFEGKARTLLVEGRVAVISSRDSVSLAPGEQVDSRDWQVRQVDPTVSSAWVKGEFKFRATAAEDVLDQISRHYGLQVIFNDSIEAHYTGTISRRESVDKVLEILESVGMLKFTLRQDTIRVSRK